MSVMERQPTPEPQNGHGSASRIEGPGGIGEGTVLVEPGQLGIFEKRFAALNKKARTFGLEPITVLSSEEALYQVTRDYLNEDRISVSITPVPPGAVPKEPIVLVRLRLSYPEIRLGNWRVIGKLEAVEGGNLQFAVSQDETDQQAIGRYAMHPISCEHCNVKRLRNDGYVLRDQATDEFKQVGSNCLEDFTGIDPKAALFLAKMWQVIKMAEGDLEAYGSSGKRNAITTHEFISNVVFLANTRGFVSASKAKETGEEPTFWTAAHLDEQMNSKQGGFTDSNRLVFKKDKEANDLRAEEIISWVADKPVESSFDENVKLLLCNKVLMKERKHLAFAAAAVPMYNRQLAAQAEQRVPSSHIGVLGERMSATILINRVIEIQGQYGTSHLILMQDESGNRLKWKASSASQELIEGVGKWLEATFKVKGHDDYKGVPQTAVTHLKVGRWLEADMDSPVYVATIYKQSADSPGDFSQPVVDRQSLTRAELLATAARFAIGKSPTPPFADRPEYMWFTSHAREDGEIYSLHLHEIDGREPNFEDYEILANSLPEQVDLADTIDVTPS